ncbi:MAG: peptidoglycan D,D-transpeptidase FtsI family protein [Mycobacteriales bacterium]
MNRGIRRLAIAVVAMFVALLVNANYVQVIEASSLRNNPHNSRQLLYQYATPRGPIIVGGEEVARSVATKGSLKYLRVYPGGPEYAPVTGFYSLIYGATGIEAAENSILSGNDPRLFVRHLSDLLTGRRPQGGAAVLTIDPKAQQAAWQALQGKTGAVVALDPRTGAILALVTSPSYNPSVLSSHNRTQIVSAYQSLIHSTSQPMLDRALDATYPPGSMFKIVDLAAAFGSGRYSANSVIPAPTRLKLPLTSIYMHNYAGESCGNGHTDTIADAFRISCDTAFAGLGMKLGAPLLAQTAAGFGFGRPLDVPLYAAASSFPANANLPQTAQSAIGQFDVQTTPLQAAMLSAAIANNGVLMKPYLVARLEAPDLSTIQSTKPQVLSRATSPAVAAQISKLMQLVVASGTGTTVQIPGVTVAGKTGTSQHGAGLPPDAWFTGFAPANNPQVAVAAIVENSAGNQNGTGAQYAGPIVRAVMEAVLRG